MSEHTLKTLQHDGCSRLTENLKYPNASSNQTSTIRQDSTKTEILAGS